MRPIYVGRQLNIFAERSANPGIGDVLLAEPAIRSLAKVTGERVPLSVVGAGRVLLDGHPDVDLLPAGTDPAPSAPGWTFIDVPEAFWWAFPKGRHFAEGFFPQFGLDPEDAPIPFREPRLPHWDLSGVERRDIVAICPFTLTDVADALPGAKRNKAVPIAWWTDFAKACPLPCVSLGGAGSPEVPGAESYYGHSLKDAAAVMKSARCVVSVVTGLLHIAGAIDCDIVGLMSESETPAFCGPRTRGRFDWIPGALHDGRHNPVDIAFSLDSTLRSVRAMVDGGTR